MQPVIYGRVGADGQSWKELLCARCGGRAFAAARRATARERQAAAPVEPNDLAGTGLMLGVPGAMSSQGCFV